MKTNKKYFVSIVFILALGFLQSVLIASEKIVDYWQVSFFDTGLKQHTACDTITVNNDTAIVVLQWKQPASTKHFDEQDNPVWYVEPDSCIYGFSRTIQNDTTLEADTTKIESELIFYVSESVWQIAIKACKLSGLESKFSQPVLYYFKHEAPPERPVGVKIKLIIQ